MPSSTPPVRRGRRRVIDPEPSPEKSERVPPSPTEKNKGGRKRKKSQSQDGSHGTFTPETGGLLGETPRDYRAKPSGPNTRTVRDYSTNTHEKASGATVRLKRRNSYSKHDRDQETLMETLENGDLENMNARTKRLQNRRPNRNPEPAAGTIESSSDEDAPLAGHRRRKKARRSRSKGPNGDSWHRSRERNKAG